MICLAEKKHFVRSTEENSLLLLQQRRRQRIKRIRQIRARRPSNDRMMGSSYQTHISMIHSTTSSN